MQYAKANELPRVLGPNCQQFGKPGKHKGCCQHNQTTVKIIPAEQAANSRDSKKGNHTPMRPCRNKFGR